MKIYIVNGAPRSGKTTFCNMVIDIVGAARGKNLSTVDKVKDIARSLGWDGEKNPKARKFLSDLKRLLIDWDDIPMKDIKNKVNNFKEELSIFDREDGAVVFIMCREPDEIEYFCKELGAQSLLVRKRSSEITEASNDSDRNVLAFNYDIVINNEGSLEDLAYTALAFVEEEGLFFPHWKTIKIDKKGNICYT